MLALLALVPSVSASPSCCAGGVADPLAPVILGALDRKHVDATVAGSRAVFRACYARELREHPDLSGKITVRFVIQGDGWVRSAELKATTMEHAEVEACVTDVFRALHFPAPEGGGLVVVSYPLMFSPG